MPDWVAHRYEAAELRKFKHRVEGGRRALARPRNAHGVFAAQRVDDGLQEGSWVAANGLTVSRGAAIPRTVDGNVVKAVRDSWSCRSEVCHLLNEQIPHHRAIPLVAPMHIQHQRILGIPDNSREHISKPPSFYPNRPATKRCPAADTSSIWSPTTGPSSPKAISEVFSARTSASRAAWASARETAAPSAPPCSTPRATARAARRASSAALVVRYSRPIMMALRSASAWSTTASTASAITSASSAAASASSRSKTGVSCTRTPAAPAARRSVRAASR
eukprot:CAMPEP_0204406806 /NCGR_PEP_ID=MMETSP0470-20130426/8310_1 /ASSEMBLY_ACC=CAM_ASM_000385 /TAXON_ID=2969 /ORGANISM="Oxyrrhis marina" /LENGTH=276 /DNA_ID=CAMNT_0051402411 /DNA_START=155 /DNA_END=981 /DNA_ORIENTATION=+